MINIQKAYDQFDEYVEQFNPEEGRIKLKIDHIKRVALMSKKIAQNLKLSNEQIELAELIGLFHDIGRFKQAQIYDTFNDRISVNHAEMGIKVLFQENLIKEFNIDEKYYNIIEMAVINHNKNVIDNNLTEEELLFCKIIRDADKLDIYYTICNYDFPSIFWYKDFNCEIINEKIVSDFINKHAIDYSIIKSNSDQIPIFYAYIFDFNFDFSLRFLKEQKYLEKFTTRVYEHFTSPVIKKQVQAILKESNDFLKE